MFVTAVPDAPIQLVGRRDPETGELCVGGALGPPRKDIPAPSGDDLPSYIEVVTGPEAERLILSVHRWLNERVEAEGLTFDEYAAKHFEREQEPKPGTSSRSASASRTGWDARHDRMAAETMAEFKLVLPLDREYPATRPRARRTARMSNETGKYGASMRPPVPLDA